MLGNGGLGGGLVGVWGVKRVFGGGLTRVPSFGALNLKSGSFGLQGGKNDPNAASLAKRPRPKLPACQRPPELRYSAKSRLGKIPTQNPYKTLLRLTKSAFFSFFLTKSAKFRQKKCKKSKKSSCNFWRIDLLADPKISSISPRSGLPDPGFTFPKIGV